MLLRGPPKSPVGLHTKPRRNSGALRFSTGFLQDSDGKGMNEQDWGGICGFQPGGHTNWLIGGMGGVPQHGILAVWGSKLGLLPAARQLCAVEAKCCRMQLEWLKMMHMSCGYWPCSCMLVLCTFLEGGVHMCSGGTGQCKFCWPHDTNSLSVGGDASGCSTTAVPLGVTIASHLSKLGMPD